MNAIPDFVLIGGPRKYKNGRGKPAKSYLQKFRLKSDSVRKVRSVSLETNDVSVARERAKDFVVKRVTELSLANSPQLRFAKQTIQESVTEYRRFLSNSGCTEKHVDQVHSRLIRLIECANYRSYSDITDSSVKDAIESLKKSGQFKTTATANRYLECAQSLTAWALHNKMWHHDPLDVPLSERRISGCTKNTRLRAILTKEEFEQLLSVTLKQSKTRKNLTAVQRYWLYLIASQTGLRCQELHLLCPNNFYFNCDQPYVQIASSISKRGKVTGKVDTINIQAEFAEMLKSWCATLPADKRLFGSSSGWWQKACPMLGEDLDAAELPRTKMTRQGEANVGLTNPARNVAKGSMFWFTLACSSEAMYSSR